MSKAGPYEGVTSTEASMSTRRRLVVGSCASLRRGCLARLTPGKRIRLHPDDYFPLGKGPRRHRRALVRQCHPCGEWAAHRRVRGSEPCRGS